MVILDMIPLMHLKPQHNNNTEVNKEVLTFKTFLSDMVLFNSLKCKLKPITKCSNVCYCELDASSSLSVTRCVYIRHSRAAVLPPPAEHQYYRTQAIISIQKMIMCCVGIGIHNNTGPEISYAHD